MFSDFVRGLLGGHAVGLLEKEGKERYERGGSNERTGEERQDEFTTGPLHPSPWTLADERHERSPVASSDSELVTSQSPDSPFRYRRRTRAGLRIASAGNSSAERPPAR